MSLDQGAMKIVEEALDLEGTEARSAFVAGACHGKPQLQQRVEQLLESVDADGTFGPHEIVLHPSDMDDSLPDRLGPWRLTSQIMRGGMGAVAKAERCDGLFEQTVAIKLIRAEIANPKARERFATERRILARLHHKSIVRIIDGGEIDGRPWLAMDFIEGEPIDAALELRMATVQERIAAFVEVAEAVVHAHRQLIVHGDIKPSNVLMDRAGAVHLLDFGIGRILDSGDPAVGENVRYPLTLNFAAPERSRGEPPTVVSDVFSLGMVLLVMLGHDVPGATTVCVAESRLPTGVIDGDLAAILRRALAIDPDQRYPDVASLVQDVRRFLTQRPVSVRMNEGWSYVATRFAGRNRKALALTAGLAFLLLIVGAGAATQFLRAQVARAEADARFEDARAMSRYLVFEMIPSLEDTPHSLAQRAAAAQIAERYLNRLAAARQAGTDLKLETAEGLLQLAMLQGRSGRPNLGQPDAAERNLVRAKALLATLPQGTGDRRIQPLLARIGIERVRLAVWLKSDLAKADHLADETRTVVQRAAPNAPSLGHDFTVVLAELRGFQGRYNEQAQLAAAALDDMARPGHAGSPLDRASLLANKAEAIYYLGSPADALPLYRQSLETLIAARSASDGPYIMGRLARAYWDMGTTLVELGHHREAIEALKHGEGAARLAVEFEPQNKAMFRMLNIVSVAKAQALGLAGRTDEALDALRANLASRRAQARQDGTPEALRDAAYASTLIGETLSAAGRTNEACAADRSARGEYDRLRARGLITPHDEMANLKLVNQRIARNCALSKS